MTYYEKFISEIEDEIKKFILPGSYLYSTTMKRIKIICETYGVDWKLDGEKKQ